MAAHGLSPFSWEFGRTGEAGLNEDRDVGSPLVGARCRPLLIGLGRATTRVAPTPTGPYGTMANPRFRTKRGARFPASAEALWADS